MSGYIASFDKSKYMTFLIKDDKVSENYDNI